MRERNVEIDRLREEIKSYRSENAALRLKNIKLQRLVDSLPKEDRTVHMYDIHPVCPSCGEKSIQHVGFRGSIIGKMFTGRDRLTIEEAVFNQNDLSSWVEHTGIPDRLPDDIGEETPPSV